MSYREVKPRRDENENPVQTDFISLMPGGFPVGILKTQYSLGKRFPGNNQSRSRYTVKRKV